MPFRVEKSYDFLLEPSDSQGFDQMLRKCSWCHRFWNCLKWSFRMLDLFNFACVVFWYMCKFCWVIWTPFCIENFYDFLHEPWLVTIDWIRMLRNCAWWHHSWNFLYWSFSSLSWLFVVIDCHRRTGRGGEGGCSPPKVWATQIFWAARGNLGKASF